MPWTCCGEELLDVVFDCPSCGESKPKWTMRFGRTRRFVVPVSREMEQVLDVEDAPWLEPALEVIEVAAAVEPALEVEEAGSAVEPALEVEEVASAIEPGLEVEEIESEVEADLEVEPFESSVDAELEVEEPPSLDHGVEVLEPAGRLAA